jgi:hypothetical protein
VAVCWWTSSSACCALPSRTAHPSSSTPSVRSSLWCVHDHTHTTHTHTTHTTAHATRLPLWPTACGRGSLQLVDEGGHGPCAVGRAFECVRMGLRASPVLRQMTSQLFSEHLLPTGTPSQPTAPHRRTFSRPAPPHDTTRPMTRPTTRYTDTHMHTHHRTRQMVGRQVARPCRTCLCCWRWAARRREPARPIGCWADCCCCCQGPGRPPRLRW